MRYNQKNPYAFLRFFVYLMGFTLIAGIAIITHTIYKRNIGDVEQHCTAPENAKVTIPGTVRQVLPIEKNMAMIVTAAENGSVSAFIYDHCNDTIVRQFSMSASVAASGE